MTEKIEYSHIRKTLSVIDQKYKESESDEEPTASVLFSKIAILELGGWLEETFDQIALTAIRPTPPDTMAIKLVQQSIKKVTGFQYDEHFRLLLLASLGAGRLAKLEKEMSQDGSLEQLKSQLISLNESRKIAAHTFTKENMSAFSAPSVTKNLLEQMLPMISKIAQLANERQHASPPTTDN